ncbi:MAG: hypothetical protein ABI743_06300, partial [bacterium]
GGRLLAEGTPRQVAEVAESYTGHYLKLIYDNAPLFTGDLVPESGESGSAREEELGHALEDTPTQPVPPKKPSRNGDVATNGVAKASGKQPVEKAPPEKSPAAKPAAKKSAPKKRPAPARS